MTKYRVTVDREICIGCGACVGICPENFEMEDGKSKPKKKVVEKLSCNQEAADNCPVSCIRVEKIKD